MQIRILGARHGESRQSHFPSIIVDGILALDAGSLTSTLSLSEQAAIHSVLLTHRHLDHIKDLATLGFNLMGRSRVNICCTHEVRAALEATILSELIWLNFFVWPTPDAPTFIHTPIKPHQTLLVAGYRVCPLPVKHAVPGTAYEVTAASGETLLYTGDSGPTSVESWKTSTPDILITEVTYPNSKTALAAQLGHLTAELLAEELKTYKDLHGFLPKILVMHADPYDDSQIAAELSTVASDLSANLELAAEGSTFTVEPASSDIRSRRHSSKSS